MYFRRKVKSVMLVFIIAMGLAIGIPMRPDQIEELLHQVNQPKIAHVLKQRSDDPDPVPEAPPE